MTLLQQDITLFDPAAHESLCSTKWNENSAHNEIQEILQETLQSYSGDHFWKEHPDDADWSPVFP